MSAKEKIIDTLEVNDVYLDFRHALSKINYETGSNKTIGSVSEECNVSKVAVKKWESKAPAIVSIIYAYMKKYNLSFEELVKEVEVKN